MSSVPFYRKLLSLGHTRRSFAVTLPKPLLDYLINDRGYDGIEGSIVSIELNEKEEFVLRLLRVDR